MDPDAVGRDGDMGLMQVIPATWGQWAPRAGVDPAAPYDAYGNVRVGAAYLAHLRGELAEDGHPEDAWALAAYNWGLTNVRGVLASDQGWEGLPRKQRQYVADILNLAGSIGE
jgi:soluble lytic murein transglycosylase-like protein